MRVRSVGDVVTVGDIQKKGGRIQNEHDLRYTQELLGGKFILKCNFLGTNIFF